MKTTPYYLVSWNSAEYGEEDSYLTAKEVTFPDMNEALDFAKERYAKFGYPILVVKCSAILSLAIDKRSQS